jgi:hypothetical protein
MLQAFHLASALRGGGGPFATMEAAMRTVVVTKAYYAAGHGVLYEMTPDWRPVAPDVTWVTSEAIGISLEGLLSTLRSTPW